MNQEFLKEIQLDAKLIEEAQEQGIHCEHLEQRFQDKLRSNLTNLDVKPSDDCPRNKDRDMCV